MERYAKQVLVVRKDLRMRKGKIAAQCAHASLAVLLRRMPRELDGAMTTRSLRYEGDTAMASWLDGRFTKVCVYVESEQALDDIAADAERLGLPFALIVDSGKTEFAGVPTKTVVAVGPAWIDEVDAVTGGLPLL